jgi:Flp pilus assembly protein TadG
MKSERGFSLVPLARRAIRLCAHGSGGNLKLATKSEDGSALVEMALVSSLLLTMVTGILIFGIFEMQVMAITEGVSSAGRALSVAAGNTLDPCATAASAFQGAAPLLGTANLTYKVVLNPTPSKGSSTATTETGSTCAATSLTTAPASLLVSGGSVQVTATYNKCSLQIFGKNFMPGGCSISQSITEIVQ